jgi:hypothetical protein
MARPYAWKDQLDDEEAQNTDDLLGAAWEVPKTCRGGLRRQRHARSP